MTSTSAYEPIKRVRLISRSHSTERLEHNRSYGLFVSHSVRMAYKSKTHVQGGTCADDEFTTNVGCSRRGASLDDEFTPLSDLHMY